MLERRVLIDGEVYDRHELVMVAVQPGRPAVATVRSSRSGGEDDATVETSHECGPSGGADLSEWEGPVWALPAFGEWEDASALLSEVASLLTDEQAARVPAAFPEWEAGAAYAEGQRVRRGGALFRCVQPHASQDGWVPGETPALWAEVRAGQQGGDGGTPAEWAQPTGAQDAYARGDRVAYGGQVWESTMDGNVWSPDAYPAGWRPVG